MKENMGTILSSISRRTEETVAFLGIDTLRKVAS